MEVIEAFLRTNKSSRELHPFKLSRLVKRNIRPTCEFGIFETPRPKADLARNTTRSTAKNNPSHFSQLLDTKQPMDVN